MVLVRNLYEAAYDRLYARRETLQLLGLGAVLLVAGLELLIRGQYSILTFLIVAAAFLIAWSLNKTIALVTVLVFEFLLGDIRRIVNMYAGYPKLDPLLLTGPIFAVAIVFPMLLKIKVSDPLSKVLLSITGIMFLETINPRQGPIAVGFAGAMFMLVPIFWFWLGRAYGTERIVELLAYRVVLPLAVLAAIIGLYQTYVGFLPWEQAWIRHALVTGYAALNIGGGHIRSFGFSVNSIEYGTLLMLGSIISVAAILSGQRAYFVILPLLLSALVLASMRGLILKLAVSIVMMWAVRGQDRRSWIKRLVFGGVFAVALLGYSVRHAASSAEEAPAPSGKATSANLATNHVTEGLAHPLDPKYSTAGMHASMFLGGFSYGFKNPLGMGLGMVTLGASRFGTVGAVGSSEVDISDAFITMGLLGGPLYVLAVILGITEATRYVLVGPRRLSYLLVGLLTGMLGSWMTLGQYAVGPFLWFCIGYVAKTAIVARQKAAELEEDHLLEDPSEELITISPQVAEA